MLTLDPKTSSLLLIDFQTRLMPAIERGEDAVANAARLMIAAGALGIPAVATEQNPKGLGTTVPELAMIGATVMPKMTFDAVRTAGFMELLPAAGSIVVAGCEAHVCVLQTVLRLTEQGRQVFVVRDAVGSRRLESKEAALARMARHGAEIITTEMAIFEWLGTAEHPKFRDIMKLVK